MKKIMMLVLLSCAILGWENVSHGEATVPFTNENVQILKGHWEGTRQHWEGGGKWKSRVLKLLKTEVEIANETFPLSGKIALEKKDSSKQSTIFENGKLKDGAVVIELRMGTIILKLLESGKLKFVLQPARSTQYDQEAILTKN
jgi:hypothetical protein